MPRRRCRKRPDLQLRGAGGCHQLDGLSNLLRAAISRPLIDLDLHRRLLVVGGGESLHRLVGIGVALDESGHHPALSRYLGSKRVTSSSRTSFTSPEDAGS